MKIILWAVLVCGFVTSSSLAVADIVATQIEQTAGPGHKIKIEVNENDAVELNSLLAAPSIVSRDDENRFLFSKKSVRLGPIQIDCTSSEFNTPFIKGGTSTVCTLNLTVADEKDDHVGNSQNFRAYPTFGIPFLEAHFGFRVDSNTLREIFQNKLTATKAIVDGDFECNIPQHEFRSRMPSFDGGSLVTGYEADITPLTVICSDYPNRSECSVHIMSRLSKEAIKSLSQDHHN